MVVCRCISTLRYGTGSFSQSHWSWYVMHRRRGCWPFPERTQILVGVLRHYVVVLLQSPPKQLSRAAIREQYVTASFPLFVVHSPPSCRRALVQSQILRATSAKSPIPPAHYKALSQHLSEAFKTGTYLKDGPPKGNAPPPAPNPLTDPTALDGMMAGMKTQMVMMVPQMIIMGWINFFFQGFVLSTSFYRVVCGG